MGVIEIESEQQFTELTKADPSKLIALYFHTPWAGPCKTMNQVFKTLADSKESDNSIIFLSINADELPEISEIFEVSAVPYFILIRNQTILKELSGADPKEFIQALNQFSNNTNSTTTSNNDNVQASINSTTANTNSNNTTTNAPEVEESEEALNERLNKLTKAAPIMLFMKGSPSSPQCGFSRQLVAILREHQVRFGFFDILKDDSVRQGLKNSVIGQLSLNYTLMVNSKVDWISSKKVLKMMRNSSNML